MASIVDRKKPQQDCPVLDNEVMVVGTGVSGLYMGIRMLDQRLKDFSLLEASDRLGGTWRDNTYPGIAVDIPSLSYSYTFEPNPNWTRLFTPGKEIYNYLNHCADKYKVRNKIRFNSKVERAEFIAEHAIWAVHLANKTTLHCRYLVVATGILSQPVIPDFEGRSDFKGKSFHTNQWDHDFDLTDKKIAIIGTGASSVQVVPAIAAKVKSLDVLQRTPVWVLPRTDVKFPKPINRLFKRLPILQWLIRQMIDTGLELGMSATVIYRYIPWMTSGIEANGRRFLASQVKDEKTRQKLTPDYDFGCKRMTMSSHYLKTFNRDNVHLVTDGIERITEKGILTADGVEREYDAIVFATGFKTQQRGNNPSFDVQGLDGLELGQFWEENRFQAFNGVSVPKFPNLFLTFGPYSGGLNWFTMIEANGRYIVRCLKKASRQKAKYVEVKQSFHDAYFALMQKMTKNTLFANGSCSTSNSYYFDRHGDASLPTPFPPIWRWFRVRFSNLNSHRFETQVPKELQQSGGSDSEHRLAS